MKETKRPDGSIWLEEAGPALTPEMAAFASEGPKYVRVTYGKARLLLSAGEYTADMLRAILAELDRLDDAARASMREE